MKTPKHAIDAIRPFLGAILSLVLLVYVFSSSKSQPTSWYSEERTIPGESVTLESSTGKRWFQRAWLIPTQQKATIRFQSKLERSLPEALRWQLSTPSIKVTEVHKDNEGFSRIQFAGVVDQYVFRYLNLEKSISGRTFEASIWLRAGENYVFNNKSGIWVQEFGNQFTYFRKIISLNRSWQKFLIRWQVPKATTTKSVRFLLNDFDNQTIEARDFKFYEIDKKEKTVFYDILPNGSDFSIDFLKQKQHIFGIFNDNHSWVNYQFVLENKSTQFSDTLILKVGLDQQVQLQIANVKVQDLVGDQDFQAVDTPNAVYRTTGFFGDPNLAGHALVAVCLLLLLISKNNWAEFIIFATMLFSVWLTGSRTAWFCLLIGGSWMILLTLNQRLKLAFLACAAIVLLAIIVFYPGDFGRLGNIDQSEVTRQSIWKAAFHAISQHPFQGITGHEFANVYQLENPSISSTRVNHAHNFWLQMGVQFGVLGLLISVAVTLLSIWLAWLWGGARGVVFSMSFVFLNIFDYSITYFGVWFAWLIGMWFLFSQKSALTAAKT